MISTSFRRLAGATLTAALLALAGASAADEEPSWFPLESGLTWSYSLELTRQGETQKLPYRVRVARREDLGGKTCAVLESRSGERLLESSWFVWEGKTLRNPRRQNGRANLELLQPGTKQGRVVLDLEALQAESPPRWEWTSGDGGAKGAIHLERREKLQLAGLGELDCLVLLEVAEFQVGARRGRQERRVWLALGLGMVQEQSRMEVEGGEATETLAVLERKPERT